jgi:transposase
MIFIDESGTHVSMTRTHGWAPRGQRLVEHVPRNRGTVLTMIGAISSRKVEAMMTKVGATTGDVFEQFVREHLAPVLRPRDVVVLDNLGAHKRRTTIEFIESLGATVLFLPPYSPDLNPIELCWSKMKDVLRQLKARTVPNLREAIDDAARAVSSVDLTGWFSHCGYRAQPT